MSIDEQVGHIRKLLQDGLAPELRSLKTELTALHQEITLRADAADTQRAADLRHIDAALTGQYQKLDARITATSENQQVTAELQYRILLSAINESRQQVELNTAKLFATVSERIAVLEATRT